MWFDEANMSKQDSNMAGQAYNFSTKTTGETLGAFFDKNRRLLATVPVPTSGAVAPPGAEFVGMIHEPGVRIYRDYVARDEQR